MDWGKAERISRKEATALTRPATMVAGTGGSQGGDQGHLVLRAVAAGSKSFCVSYSYYYYLFLLIKVSYHGTPPFVGVGGRDARTRLGICVAGAEGSSEGHCGATGLSGQRGGCREWLGSWAGAGVWVGLRAQGQGLESEWGPEFEREPCDELSCCQRGSQEREQRVMCGKGVRGERQPAPSCSFPRNAYSSLLCTLQSVEQNKF